MRNLKKYIEQRNVWRGWQKKPPLDVKTLSIKDMNELFNAIDNALSPENLCCDGELRGAALTRKARMLNGAKAELEEHAKSRGHTLVLDYTL